MKVLVVSNIHLVKDNNGNYYSSSVYSYDFFKRYLEVFDEVKIVGKTKLISTVDLENYKRVNGPNIEIVPLPWYQGIKQMVRKLPELICIFRHVLDECDCCIFRIAQVESFFTYVFGNMKALPYAVEVVNDPETFTDMPFLYRKFSTLMVKKMCKHAVAASYVTKKFLQRKYPTKANFCTYYSSIELHQEDIGPWANMFEGKNEFKIVHVSNSINSDIKGHYTVIKAAERVLNAGYKITVDFIGDGTKVEEYQKYIDKHLLGNKIHFIGKISGRKQLLKLISEYNLMVLPTKMEGLPRTIIEAMAVGLPCISTPIAGVPELLSADYLFAPDDDKAFADEIMHLINNPDELKIMSKANIKVAQEYTTDILTERRNKMYLFLKKSCSFEKVCTKNED